VPEEVVVDVVVEPDVEEVDVVPLPVAVEPPPEVLA